MNRIELIKALGNLDESAKNIISRLNEDFNLGVITNCEYIERIQDLLNVMGLDEIEKAIFERKDSALAGLALDIAWGTSTSNTIMQITYFCNGDIEESKVSASVARQIVALAEHYGCTVRENFANTMIEWNGKDERSFTIFEFDA